MRPRRQPKPRPQRSLELTLSREPNLKETPKPHEHENTHEDDGQGIKVESARNFILLSLVAAVFTIALKGGAWALTGSVGLLSDAAESVINLLAAGLGFWLLTVAARPPDEEHAYGHSKAEYIASGAESSLIIVAAGAI